MKMTKKTIIALLVTLLVAVYVWYPDYILQSGPFGGFRIVDSYADEYYINCEGSTLYKKNPAKMNLSDRKWIADNILPLYKKRLERFDNNGGSLRLVTTKNWVDGFTYKYSLFTENGDLEETYENISSLDGVYYMFSYTYLPGDVEQGLLSSFSPTTDKEYFSHSYNFDVGLAKKSCSTPQ